jgi:hypothetical protein
MLFSLIAESCSASPGFPTEAGFDGFIGFDGSPKPDEPKNFHEPPISEPTKPTKPTGVIAEAGFDGFEGQHKGIFKEREPESSAKTRECEPSKPTELVTPVVLPPEGFVGFESLHKGIFKNFQSVQSVQSVDRASEVLRDAGVQFMDLPGIGNPVIGIWSDLDSPAVRGALDSIGFGYAPLRYLDDDGIPAEYTTRTVPGTPVPAEVRREMERFIHDDDAAWERREIMLAELPLNRRPDASRMRPLPRASRLRLPQHATNMRSGSCPSQDIFRRATGGCGCA